MLKKLLAEAGLPDSLLHFHELRHTAVSGIYEATRNLALAQKFARHRSSRTTQIYVHCGDQAMVEAMSRLTC